jgi:hypothetical protein
LKKLFVLLPLVVLIGCSDKKLEPKVPAPTPTTKPKIPREIKGDKALGYFTYYFSPILKSDPRGKTCLQDMSGKCISKPLNADKACFIQMQGSGMVDGVFYSYAGESRRYIKHSCSKWGSIYAPQKVVRFEVDTKTTFGKGSFSNELVPYRSLACPIELKNNQIIFIPEAKGKLIPPGVNYKDQFVHDGIFKCHDRGGNIKKKGFGKYRFDLFIGLVDFTKNWKMNDWAKPYGDNPFRKLSGDKTVPHRVIIAK